MPSLLAEDLLRSLLHPRELVLEDILDQLDYQEGTDLGRLVRTYYLRSDGERMGDEEYERSMACMPEVDRTRLAEIERHFVEIVDQWKLPPPG